jgi:hypothetical protein
VPVDDPVPVLPVPVEEFVPAPLPEEAGWVEDAVVLVPGWVLEVLPLVCPPAELVLPVPVPVHVPVPVVGVPVPVAVHVPVVPDVPLVEASVGAVAVSPGALIVAPPVPTPAEMPPVASGAFLCWVGLAGVPESADREPVELEPLAAVPVAEVALECVGEVITGSVMTGVVMADWLTGAAWLESPAAERGCATATVRALVG